MNETNFHKVLALDVECDAKLKHKTTIKLFIHHVLLTAVLSLTSNYRCPPIILGISMQVISRAGALKPHDIQFAITYVTLFIGQVLESFRVHDATQKLLVKYPATPEEK